MASGDTKYGINSRDGAAPQASSIAADPARPAVFRNSRRSITRGSGQ
jgi:hypothetical protein